MATDVQHIISISLNKIMASRQRKGGISLHRNLLVASVLFRAKDAYIAETVAKRKRDMDSEAIVPTFQETEEEGEALPDSMEDMETDVSNIPESDVTSEQYDMDDLKYMDEIEKIEDFDDRDSYDENSEFEQSSTNPLDSSVEQLENLSAQIESGLISKPQPVCSRKRRSCVLDSDRKEFAQEVSSSCADVVQNSNIEDRTHSEYSQEGPSTKVSRLESPCDVSYNQSVKQHEAEFSTQTHNNTDSSWDSSDDDDEEDDDEDDNVNVVIDCSSSSYMERESSNCYSEVYSSDSHSFVPQVCSNLLIATM